MNQIECGCVSVFVEYVATQRAHLFSRGVNRNEASLEKNAAVVRHRVLWESKESLDLSKPNSRTREIQNKCVREHTARLGAGHRN